MQSTRKRQKFPKRGSRQDLPPLPPPSAPVTQSSSHLEEFFAQYSPQFQYNIKVSASWEFYRLCDESGWDRDDPDRKDAHQSFKAALVRQFNTIYGTDVNDIRSWQNLCHVVRIDPIPDDLHACRDAVYYTFVNLVDLVDTKNTDEEVPVFESEVALSEYTCSTGKFFSREEAEAGGVLKYLLRHILHPRDGYDVSRRRRGGGGGKGLRRHRRR